MDVRPIQLRPALRLGPFHPRYAAVITGWVPTSEELHWLAPSTTPPLTARKVLAWKKPHGYPLLAWAEPMASALADAGQAPASRLASAGGSPSQSTTPIGYAELNPMRRDPEHFWLGHVVLDPAHRGRGIGRAFVLALLPHAFERLGAVRVSLIVFPGNERALRCYRSAGLSDVGEEYHRFGNRGPKRRLLRLEAARPGGAESSAT